MKVWNTKGTHEKIRDSESSKQRVFGIEHVDCKSIKLVIYSVKSMIKTELPDVVVLTLN